MSKRFRLLTNKDLMLMEKMTPDRIAKIVQRIAERVKGVIDLPNHELRIFLAVECDCCKKESLAEFWRGKWMLLPEGWYLNIEADCFACSPDCMGKIDSRVEIENIIEGTDE